MSLRSSFTKLGHARRAGLSTAATWARHGRHRGPPRDGRPSGFGCDGDDSLQACGDAGAYCVCDGYGCRPADTEAPGAHRGGRRSHRRLEGHRGSAPGHRRLEGQGHRRDGDVRCRPTTCRCARRRVPQRPGCVDGPLHRRLQLHYECGAGTCATTAPACPAATRPRLLRRLHLHQRGVPARSGQPAVQRLEPVPQRPDLRERPVHDELHRLEPVPHGRGLRRLGSGPASPTRRASRPAT